MLKKHLIKALGLSVLAIVGVMAVTASAAQANYVLELNEKPVTLLHLLLEGLHGLLVAENGLEILCTGGHGLAHVVNNGATVTGNANGTFTGCVWVGAEETCIIEDPEGGEGVIKAEGTGEVVMEEGNYKVVTTNENEFAVVYTEGLFCTIPEEEVVEGTASASLPDAEEEIATHLASLHADSLRLGGSNVKSLEGEVHITDLDPEATFSIHLTAGL